MGSFDLFTAAFTQAASPLIPAPRVLSDLIAAARLRRLDKGDHLCRQGDQADALFFVNEGLLRYYLLADGVEHIGQFFDKGMFVVDVGALVSGEPASHNIDALEVTEVVIIPRAALLAAYDADHAAERFGRRSLEDAMAGSQRRTANLLLLSPEQRYARFVATRPEVALRIPLYLTAAYLGITPEALSRIRRRRTSG